jgi:C1A family cysteine protease
MFKAFVLLIKRLLSWFLVEETRVYNHVRDTFDSRDYVYKPSGAALPAGVDLRPMCPPIYDQGALGSCQSNAACGAEQFLELKDKLPAAPPLSRLMCYYGARAIEGTVKQDAGASLRDTIKGLAKSGVCIEALWPYVVSKFKTKPSSVARTTALTRLITSYSTLSSLNDMKDCLASGFPFIFGFQVYSAFESAEVAKTGIVELPTKGETLLGGHAVMAVGYDDTVQRFIVRNSWGASWGQAGYFTIPYTYLTNPKLASDFWTIRRGEQL